MFLKLERSAPGWPIREVVSEEPGEIQGCLWLLICVFPQPNTDTKLTPEKVCALSQTQRGRTYVLSVLKSPCLCLVIHRPALLFWDSSWLTAERCQLWLQKPLEESRVPSRAMFSLLPVQQLPTPSITGNSSDPESFGLCNDSDAQHLYMGFVAFCISSLEKCLFKCFAHFKIRLFGFVILAFIFQILTPYIISYIDMICKLFSPSFQVTFYSVDCVLLNRSFSFLTTSNFSDFACVLSVIFKKIIAKFNVIMLLPIF